MRTSAMILTQPEGRIFFVATLYETCLVANSRPIESDKFDWESFYCYCCSSHLGKTMPLFLLVWLNRVSYFRFFLWFQLVLKCSFTRYLCFPVGKQEEFPLKLMDRMIRWILYIDLCVVFRTGQEKVIRKAKWTSTQNAILKSKYWRKNPSWMHFLSSRKGQVEY